MAILRGGKRIGGFDVRIGIPRDRSLDNVTGDPRLKRTQGGNPETTLGRFQSFVNEAEGFLERQDTMLNLLYLKVYRVRYFQKVLKIHHYLPKKNKRFLVNQI